MNRPLNEFYEDLYNVKETRGKIYVFADPRYVSRVVEIVNEAYNHVADLLSKELEIPKEDMLIYMNTRLPREVREEPLPLLFRIDRETKTLKIGAIGGYQVGDTIVLNKAMFDEVPFCAVDIESGTYMCFPGITYTLSLDPVEVTAEELLHHQTRENPAVNELLVKHFMRQFN